MLRLLALWLTGREKFTVSGGAGDLRTLPGSANLTGHVARQGLVALRVDLSHVGLGMTQQDLGRLKAKALADFCCEHMSNLIRVEDGNPRAEAGALDRLPVGFFIVCFTGQPLRSPLPFLRALALRALGLHTGFVVLHGSGPRRSSA